MLRTKADVEWKEGDNNDPPRLQLFSRDGTPVNLVGATVTQTPGGQATVNNASEGILTPVKTGLVVGDHHYQDYLIEYWVEFSDGSTQPFPESGYYRARVWKKLEEGE